MHAREACAGTGSRRELLKAALGVAVAGLAPGSSSAQGDPRNARPQTGDRFVYSTGPKKGSAVAPGDLPLGGPHVTAYAQDPATGVVRDGSRLNEVILVRLDPADLTDAARANAPHGYVALSAICTHAGCSDWAWEPGKRMLKCPCHESRIRSEGRRPRLRWSRDPAVAAAAAQGRGRRARRCRRVRRPGRERSHIGRRFQGPPTQKSPGRTIGNPVRCTHIQGRGRMHTRKIRQHCTSMAACFAALAGLAALPAAAQGVTSYAAVTEARLLKPEPENWLHYRGNFEGWGYSSLAKITPANVGRLKPVWTLSTGVVEGHQAPPFVNNGVMFVSTPGNQVHGAQCEDRGSHLALQARAARGHHPVASDEPRGRPVGEQGLPRDTRCLRRRARRAHRQGALGNQGRRLQARLLLHAGAARRQGQGDGRHLRRRVRDPRLRGGARRGNRQGSLALLYDSRPGRARQRNLEGRGPLENGRGLGLDHRALRSEVEPRVLGHRQSGAVAGRHAPGRQPVHGFRHRARRRYREAARLSPVRAERIVGLGRGIDAASHRLQAQGPQHRRARPSRRATATCGCSSASRTRSSSSTPSPT